MVVIMRLVKAEKAKEATVGSKDGSSVKMVDWEHSKVVK